MVFSRMKTIQIQKYFPLIFLPVCLATLYFFATFLGMIEPRMTNPYPNSGTETQPVWGAMQVAKGNVLYRDFLHELPIIPLTYGSLTYVIPGWIAGAVGKTDYWTIISIGRWMALSGFIATIILTVISAKRYTKSLPYALIAITPVWWFPYMNEWATKYLPDFAAVAFSLLGWLVVSRNTTSKGDYIKYTAAALCWTAAWHFKPIALVGIIAYASEIFYAFLADKNFKSAVKKSAPFFITAALCITTATVLNINTNGLWRLNTVTTAQQCQWNPKYIFETYKIAPTVLWIPLQIVFALLCLRKSPIAFALLIETLVATLFMMKQGANINYLIGSVLLFGICLAQMIKDSSPDFSAHKIIAVYSCGIGLTAMCLNRNESLRISTEYIPPVSNPYFHTERLLPELKTNRIISMIPEFGLMHNCDILFADNFHLALLSSNTALTPEIIKARVEENGYNIIFTEPLVMGYHGLRSINNTLNQRFSESWAKTVQVDAATIIIRTGLSE